MADPESPDNGEPMRIVGYGEKPSVAPGETIRFFVSCEDGIETYRADVVRLLNGDLDPRGPGYKDEPLETDLAGEYPGRKQVAHSGSYVIVPPRPILDLTGSFSIAAMIWPTTPEKGRQGILTKWSERDGAGYGLVIGEGGELALCLGDGRGGRELVASGKPLQARCWYFVGASFDAGAGVVALHQAPIASRSSNLSSLAPREGSTASVSREVSVTPASTDAPLIIAGWVEDAGGEKPLIGAHYNGKIDRPRLAGEALSRERMEALIDDPAAAEAIGAWDFAAEITSEGVRPFRQITDRSPNRLDGETVNAPARAMTGYNWSGEDFRYSDAPQSYGAIHFHDDDLDDARWDADFELRVPEETKSGIYAVHLRAGEEEDHVPFYIRPPRDRATAEIGLLIPTASYLAYANDNVGVDAEIVQLISGRTPILSRQNLHLHQHREYGASLYDLHSDDSGICYSSWRRPILTARPKYRHSFARVWQYNADLHLTDWLAQKGFDVDVFTDQDLHRDGAELLERYRVVLTGTHPEYHSGAMLDGIEAYLQGGGRFVYLGGNGFYWVISFDPDDPGMIEVRRWGGTGSWSGEPGEYYHSFSGEMGGTWRNRGRPPQKLVGVGFIAQGFDISSYYRRRPDSFDPRASWIFEGIEDDELIGDFGLVGDGAAGLEIDWYDPDLGSPPHAALLATSEAHSGVITEVRENYDLTLPNLGGEENPNVRADLVYFTTPNGGAVLSTGSIAWCASLSHNGYDNNVSRITENVIRRFASGEPLESS